MMINQGMARPYWDDSIIIRRSWFNIKRKNDGRRSWYNINGINIKSNNMRLWFFKKKKKKPIWAGNFPRSLARIILRPRLLFWKIFGTENFPEKRIGKAYKNRPGWRPPPLKMKKKKRIFVKKNL
jgi:hypothetical protein